MLARHPLFYTLKGWALRLRGRDSWRYYRIAPGWRAMVGLGAGWRRVDCVSLLFTLRLERRMRRAGMPPSQMPSTGMVAHAWLADRLSRADQLHLIGFTHEGWEGMRGRLSAACCTRSRRRRAGNCSEVWWSGGRSEVVYLIFTRQN